MNQSLDRRSFLKRTALAAGAITAASYAPPLFAIGKHKVGDVLNVVQIGCGQRANDHAKAIYTKNKQNPYAFVDPDPHGVEVLRKGRFDTSKSQVFQDYRVMFDKIGKNIDAVFITTPNHHHATAAMWAMERGINVYCEKPLCHDIAEARMLRKMANKHRVAAQMGNQGHCEEGYIRLCEFIAAGVIGNVIETHSWTDRANGGIGPRPATIPVPDGMNWDLWIGPAPYRDYHSDLHPHEWHGWYDFGNGSLGNMGCHALDGVFWALKVEHPTSVELEQVRGGSDERYPTGCRLRWDIPARGSMPAFKAYWYEGLNPTTKGEADGVMRRTKGSARNLPPMVLEFMKKYPDEQFDGSGTIYVGEKGVIYTATYGDRMHVIPEEKMSEIKQPPKTLPRPKDVFTDFIDACLAGKTQTAAPFDYGAQLTEFCLIGNLAQHAGLNNKVEWDGHNMKVKNIKALNAWVKREPRKGWKA